MLVPEFDEDDVVYRKHGADEGRPLSETVLRAIAEHEGVDLMDAEFTLYDVVDPSALDALFRFDREAETTVSFAIGDSSVFLRDVGDGVEVRAFDVPGG